jgi:hypothetical protein
LSEALLTWTPPSYYSRMYLQEHNTIRQLPQLPEDVLARILSHVPLQQRLGSCSLASRAMHAAAAAAATDAIQHNTLKLQSSADALSAWLQQYGSQALKRLEIDTPDFINCKVKLPLPWHCLTQLQHLKLKGGSGLQLGLDDVSAPSTGQAQQQQQQQVTAAALAGRGVMTRRAAAAAAATAAAATAAVTRDCSANRTLAVLTALTRLEICCTLPIRSSSTRWITNQLQPLTNLRSLTLGSLGQVGSNYLEHPPEDNPALGQVIGQLVQLTALDINAGCDGRVLSAVSNLSELRELEISNVGSADHPIQLQDLPNSLTYCILDEGVLDCTVADSWQMPQLQELRVAEWEGAGFRPALLNRMLQLRCLDLSVEVRSNPPWGITDVLAVLPQLQHLQRLKLYGMQHWPEIAAAEIQAEIAAAELHAEIAPAAAAAAGAAVAAAQAAVNAAEAAAVASSAALTASRWLSVLSCEDCRFPAGSMGRMFPAGWRLPFLQVLDFNCCEGDLECYAFHDEDSDPSVFSRCSLQMQLGELRGLVQCCPDLREVSALWVDSGIRWLELQQLLQLTKLTKLGIGGDDVDDDVAVGVLAHMTGGRLALHFMFKFD